MKTGNVINLTREDLQENKTELRFDEIDIYDFRATSMSREQMHKSDIIVFQDDDAKLKYLKDRYNVWPLNK